MHKVNKKLNKLKEFLKEKKDSDELIGKFDSQYEITKRLIEKIDKLIEVSSEKPEQLKSIRINNISDIKIPKQLSTVSVKKPSWFKQFSLNDLLSQLTDILLALSKRRFKADLDEYRSSKNPISIRLSNGKNFINQLSGGALSGGGITDVELRANPVEVAFESNVQNPLPTDGDSVYVKDIWLSESTSKNFTGDVTDLFNNLHTQIVNSESENPKTLFIHFNRTIVSNTIGLGDSQGGDFSNVKIEIINSGGVAVTVLDESAVNTKYTTRTFQLPVTAGYNALRITFHTTDTVSLSNCVILKTRSVVSRGQAVKPDGTVIDLNATAGGNQKFSLEEYDETFNTNPLPVMDMDYLARVKAGLIEGHRLIHKFGRNSAVGTSFVPIAIGGVYQTPLTNQTLELLSSSASDSSVGVGAREVTVQGEYFLNGNLVDQEEVVVTDGTNPVILTKQFSRVNRAFVSGSGTYATMTSVSAVGDIIVRDQGGAGVDWLTIDQFATGNSAGQSQCALVTTSSNTRSVLYSPTFSIDSTKVGNIMFFHRPDADVVVAPFSARRVVQQWDGIKAPDGSPFLVPFASFTGAADVGFMGKVSVGTGSISANFWVLEVDDGF